MNLNLYARYVSWIYLKSFLIVFLSLEFFYVGIDLLINLNNIPTSANLQLLYIGITALTAISYVMPISLVFGLIITHINMVRSNELISFYSLGISKNAIIMPPFFIAIFIVFLYACLNFTPFAYAYDYQKSLSKGLNFNQNTNDSFLKFDGKFIYIKELNSLEKSIKDIAVFDLNDTTLKSATFAKSAEFLDNYWIFKDARVTTLPKNLEVGLKGLDIQIYKDLKTLNGFSPKSIQSANSSERTALSAIDTLDFIFTFKSEGASINFAKATLYSLLVSPFFAPFLMLIIYYKLPVYGRFFNLALSSFVYVLTTLVVWGFLFLLSKFSNSGVILPEIGILLPVILLFAYSFYLFKTHR